MSFIEDNCMPLNKMNLTLSKDKQVQKIGNFSDITPDPHTPKPTTSIHVVERATLQNTNFVLHKQTTTICRECGT